MVGQDRYTVPLKHLSGSSLDGKHVFYLHNITCFGYGIFADTASDFAKTPTYTMQAKMVSGWKGCPISGTTCGKFTYYPLSTSSTTATEYWLENPPKQQAMVYIGDQWITTNGAEISMTQALVEPLAISFPCSLSVSGSTSTEPYRYTVVLADIDGAIQTNAQLSESWQLWTATNYYCNANGGFCESNVKIGTACTTSCSVTTWITSATTCTDNTAGSKVCMAFATKPSMKTYTMTVDKLLVNPSIVNLESAFNTIDHHQYYSASGTRSFTIDSLVTNTTATPPFTTINFQVLTTITSVSTAFAAATKLTFDVNTTPVTVKSGAISGSTVTWTFNEDISTCVQDSDTTNCGTDMKTAIATLGGTFASHSHSGYLSPPTVTNNYQIVADYSGGTVPTSAEVTAAAGKQITPAKLFPNVVTAATETETSTISTATPIAGVWFYATHTF